MESGRARRSMGVPPLIVTRKLERFRERVCVKEWECEDVKAKEGGWANLPCHGVMLSSKDGDGGTE